MLYFVAWKPGREERQFLLHRFDSATVLDTPAEPDDDFDLDAHLARGELGYVVGDPIELVARFDARAARVVTEAPLSTDQRLEPAPGGEVRVRATVADTLELRGWLLGFGPAVVVEGPPHLVEYVVATVKAMAERYGIELRRK
jgi:predicted DNA-binding transcriptional regulator YafY